MISIIKFTGNRLMPEVTAKELKLVYSTVLVGSRAGELQAMESGYDRYKDTLEKVEDEEGNTVYKEDGKVIQSYYLYDRVTEQKGLVLAQQEQLVNLLDFASKCTYEFSISRSVESDPVESLPSALAAIEDKVTNLIASIEAIDGPGFNSAYNVPIGGDLLVTFNDIKLVEDACSDLLATELQAGWRMVAVCVQPNQRRPDYILGRYNSASDLAVNAKR